MTRDPDPDYPAAGLAIAVAIIGMVALIGALIGVAVVHGGS